MTAIWASCRLLVMGSWLLSGLCTANLNWQTLVGKLRKVDKLFPSHFKFVSNNKQGNLQHGRFLSVVALTYTTVKQRKRREETESGVEIERFGRNPVCQRAPPFDFVCFYSCLCRVKMRRPKRVLAVVPHFVSCQAYKSREYSSFSLVDNYQHMLANRSHVRFESTNTKKLTKKLAGMEASYFCCQQFANLFVDYFCAFHIYQLEFGNTCLPTLV